MNIGEKSTGTLIDEYITTQFKLEHKTSVEAHNRLKLLDDLLEHRMQNRWFMIGAEYKELINVLRECWNAQEVIMTYQNFVYSPLIRDDIITLARIAEAALVAQRTNAQRNRLIRRIDSLLGEDDITPLGKTYDNSSNHAR